MNSTGKFFKIGETITIFTGFLEETIRNKTKSFLIGLVFPRLI